MHKIHRADGLAALRPLGWGMLLASTMLSWGPRAMAQTAPTQVADSSGSESALGEMVVTAEKRTENLQNVPMSIQALGTAKLEELHVENFNDYIKFLPSVSYQTVGPGMSNIYMRGIAADNQSNHSGSLPSVGTYLDEQPITTIGGALDIHVYDIARVESLAGPQGTLYGASSEAGTIRIITNPPEPGKFLGAWDAEVNQVDHGGVGYTGEGFINVPLGDKAAIRLVGWDEHDAGYIDNVLGTRTFSTGITVNNAALVQKHYNHAETFGGRAALKVDLNENWTVTPSIVAQDERNNGIFGYDPSVGDLKVSHFRPESQHDSWYQAALTVQGKISDFDIVYSGGHMDRRISSISDYTDYSFFYDQVFTTAHYSFAGNFVNNSGQFIDPTQEIIGRDHFTKDNHEIRVSSPQNERLRAIVGLFYQRQTHFIFQDYAINNLSTNLSVTGFPGTIWLTDQLRTDRDYAAFGEVSFDILPNLTLTGGVRVYRADNSLKGFYGFSANFSSHTGEAICFAPTSVDRGPCTDLNKEIVDTGETHKVNLTWRIDPDKLVYATYSTGFRPGGVNRNGGVGVPPYRPDYLSNYEVGWKTSWLGDSLRFNGAAFWEQWQNFQFSFLGQNSLTVVANAGNARILGVESDIDWRATHNLTLSGSATYIDAQLQQDFCGGSPCSATNLVQAPRGTQLPVTPKFKANATALYEWDIGQFHAHARATVVYQGSSWSDLLTQAPIPGTTTYVPVRGALGLQRAYATADFGVGVAKGPFTAELLVLNAFDTRAQLYRYAECTIQVCGAEPYIVPNRPRTIAIRIGQSF